MFRSLGGRKEPLCCDSKTALAFLCSENASRLSAAVVFVSRRIAQLSSKFPLESCLPPLEVVKAIIEHGLNAESESIRERCYRVLIVTYKFHRVFRWDQVRRVVKRELVDTETTTSGAFNAALQLLCCLTPAELCTFACSKDGSLCLRSVYRIGEPLLRYYALPAVARVLLAAWKHAVLSPDGIEGLMFQRLAADACEDDPSDELPTEEHRRLREDLQILMDEFFRDVAKGCIGPQPSTDPLIPLPDDVTAAIGCFSACGQLVAAYSLPVESSSGFVLPDLYRLFRGTAERKHGGSPTLPSAFAALAPFIATVVKVWLGDGGADGWDVLCLRASSLAAGRSLISSLTVFEDIAKDASWNSFTADCGGSDPGSVLGIVAGGMTRGDVHSNGRVESGEGVLSVSLLLLLLCDLAELQLQAGPRLIGQDVPDSLTLTISEILVFGSISSSSLGPKNARNSDDSISGEGSIVSLGEMVLSWARLHLLPLVLTAPWAIGLRFCNSNSQGTEACPSPNSGSGAAAGGASFVYAQGSELHVHDTAEPLSSFAADEASYQIERDCLGFLLHFLLRTSMCRVNVQTENASTNVADVSMCSEDARSEAITVTLSLLRHYLAFKSCTRYNSYPTCSLVLDAGVTEVGTSSSIATLAKNVAVETVQLLIKQLYLPNSRSSRALTWVLSPCIECLCLLAVCGDLTDNDKSRRFAVVEEGNGTGSMSHFQLPSNPSTNPSTALLGAVAQLAVLVFTTPTNLNDQTIAADPGSVRSLLGQPLVSRVLRSACIMPVSHHITGIGSPANWAASSATASTGIERSDAGILTDTGSWIVGGLLVAMGCRIVQKLVSKESALLAVNVATVVKTENVVIHARTKELSNALGCGIFLINKLSHILSVTSIDSDNVFGSSVNLFSDRCKVGAVAGGCWLQLVSTLSELVLEQGPACLKLCQSTCSTMNNAPEVTAALRVIRAAQMELLAALDNVLDWHFDDPEGAFNQDSEPSGSAPFKGNVFNSSSSTILPLVAAHKIGFVALFCRYAGSMASVFSSDSLPGTAGDGKGTRDQWLRPRAAKLLRALENFFCLDSVIGEGEDSGLGNGDGLDTEAWLFASRVGSSVRDCELSVAESGSGMSTSRRCVLLAAAAIRDLASALIAYSDIPFGANNPSSVNLAMIARLRRAMSLVQAAASKHDTALVLIVRGWAGALEAVVQNGHVGASATTVSAELIDPVAPWDAQVETMLTARLCDFSLQQFCEFESNVDTGPDSGCIPCPEIGNGSQLIGGWTVVSGASDPLIISISFALSHGTDADSSSFANIIVHIRAINSCGFTLPRFAVTLVMDYSPHPGTFSAFCDISSTNCHELKIQGGGSAPFVVLSPLRPVDFLPRGAVATWVTNLSPFCCTDGTSGNAAVSWTELALSLVGTGLRLRVDWLDLDLTPEINVLGLFTSSGSVSGSLTTTTRANSDTSCNTANNRIQSTLSPAVHAPLSLFLRLPNSKPLTPENWQGLWTGLERVATRVRVRIFPGPTSGNMQVTPRGWTWLGPECFCFAASMVSSPIPCVAICLNRQVTDDSVRSEHKRMSDKGHLDSNNHPRGDTIWCLSLRASNMDLGLAACLDLKALLLSWTGDVLVMCEREEDKFDY